MKPILSILILMFLVSCVSKQKQKDLSVHNLGGNVKHVIEKKSDAVKKFGEITNGKLSSETVMDFNKDGNMLKLTSTYYWDSKPDKKLYIFQYDSKGRKISVKDSNDKKPKITFSYNSDEFVDETSYFDSNGNIELKTKHKYDENGLPLESNNYNIKGDLIEKAKYKQNSNGDPIEVIFYNGNGSFKSSLNYTYNSNNHLIELKFLEDKVTDIYKYNYPKIDNNKNWLKQIEYYNGKLQTVTDRIIEYY